MLIALMEFVRSLFTEKREALFSILVFSLLGFALYFVYSLLTREKDTNLEDVRILKEQHVEEIKALRAYQLEADIEYQREISLCNREKRIAIDSIEEYYYNKVKELRTSLKKVEAKFNLLNKRQL